MAEKYNSFRIAQSDIRYTKRQEETCCPLLCEEEMVHTAIISNDMDKMKLVYQCAHQVRGSIENLTNRDRPDI